MEDVLEVYTRPYDPCRPQVCLDETSRQLLGEVTEPLPVAPGRPARQDYEYQRRGVCNVFLVCETLSRSCWCKTTSTPTRPRRCTRRSRPRRPSGWPTSWSCTTRPSTAAG